MSSIASVFVGQAAQYVGMGMDFLESDSDWFDSVEEQTPFPLRQYLQEGPEEILARTDITQPSVFVTNHLIYRYLREHGFEADVYLGHSLGEYNAVVASGRVAFEELYPVVLERGQAMQDVAETVDGGMAAVLKIESDLLIEIADEISALDDVEGTVEVALFNAPNHVVVSGSIPAVEEAADRAKKAGALKAVRLDVSGPWHSQYMEPATDRLKRSLESISWESGDPLVSNVEAAYLQGRSPSRSLVDQLEKPVRWSDSIEKLLQDGIDTFVEIGPGTALSGMIKRIARDGDYTVNIYHTDTREQTDQTLEAIV